MKVDNFVLAVILSIMFMLGWILSKKWVMYNIHNEVKVELTSSLEDFNKLTDEYDSLSAISITDPRVLNDKFVEVVRTHERLTIFAKMNLNLEK